MLQWLCLIYLAPNPLTWALLVSVFIICRKREMDFSKACDHLRQQILYNPYIHPQDNTQARGTAGQTAYTALPLKENKLLLRFWPACKRTHKGKVISLTEMGSHGLHYKQPKRNIRLTRSTVRILRQTLTVKQHNDLRLAFKHNLWRHGTVFTFSDMLFHTKASARWILQRSDSAFLIHTNNK